MDLGALQKMLSDDSATGRTPLLIIADAGTPVTGHVDNISRIRELCKIHGAWLHLRGHSLASLALPNHQRNGHVRFRFTFHLRVIKSLHTLEYHGKIRL